MNSEKKTGRILEDVKINIKMKLSGLWVTVMFLFAYVDIMGKYQPGHIEDIMAGEVAGMQITQVWILGVIIIMTTAILMVFLSLTLKPKANRWANIIVGIFHIVFVISALFIGESWAYYKFGSIVEVVLLSLIVVYAWKWPKQED
jgi:CHASE2 domain-containing sensor protein